MIALTLQKFGEPDHGTRFPPVGGGPPPVFGIADLAAAKPDHTEVVGRPRMPGIGRLRPEPAGLLLLTTSEHGDAEIVKGTTVSGVRVLGRLRFDLLSVELWRRDRGAHTR